MQHKEHSRDCMTPWYFLDYRVKSILYAEYCFLHSAATVHQKLQTASGAKCSVRFVKHYWGVHGGFTLTWE